MINEEYRMADGNAATQQAAYDQNVSWRFPDFTEVQDDHVADRTFTLNENGLIGTAREIVSNGIYIWHGQFVSQLAVPMQVTFESAHIQMIFSLEGGFSYSRDESGKPFLRFRSTQHNMMLLPGHDLFLKLKPRTPVEIFSINISPSVFFQNLPVSHPVYEHFEKGIEKLLPAFLSLRNLPVTPRMVSLLSEIQHTTFEDYYKGMLIRAKVIELMATQFEQYEQMPVPDITANWKQADKERMHQAQRILSEQMDKSWSLKELAHRVGTNEFSLKKCFKEEFGKPVFGYLHELRMESSMTMLQNSRQLVSEIAQQVGYKNPTHFTAAFKKYFGILPNKIRIGVLHMFHFWEYLTQLIQELSEFGSVAEFI